MGTAAEANNSQQLTQADSATTTRLMPVSSSTQQWQAAGLVKLGFDTTKHLICLHSSCITRAQLGLVFLHELVHSWFNPTLKPSASLAAAKHPKHNRNQLLTSSSLPSLPTSAVSTMPSSGSAASARAAGTASCHMSLSHLDCSHDRGLLFLLLLMLSGLLDVGAAALLQSGAASASDEAAALTAATAALLLLL
jgi:hypothetical protein